MLTTRTCTGLHVACAGCDADTILAAIRGCRITTSSATSAAATSFRARGKPRPATIHCNNKPNRATNVRWGHEIIACSALQCYEPYHEQPSSPTPTSRTWANLRVTRLSRIACTILAAIGRCRLATRSALSTATTSFRARPKIRPSAIQYTVLCNASCNVTNECTCMACVVTAC